MAMISPLGKNVIRLFFLMISLLVSIDDKMKVKSPLNTFLMYHLFSGPTTFRTFALPLKKVKSKPQMESYGLQ